MSPRVRDVEDSVGTCLRLVVSAHPSGPVVTLERRDLPGAPSIMLSLYGAELLNSFIMSARLTLPGEMPDEVADGAFPARFHLGHEPAPHIFIDQDDTGEHVQIPANMWDRLYAELGLITAHGRELGREQGRALARASAPRLH